MPSKHSESGARSFIHRSIPDDPKNRHPDDFYRTPPIATQRLLAVEEFRGVVWEPACGDGMMAQQFKEVVATDLHDRGYGQTGIDFLTHTPQFRFDHIVTNPPFTYIREFVERALYHRPKKVAMIARLSWLEGKTRKKFFENSGLTRVWVFSGRVDIARSGYGFHNGGEGGMIAYAWYVWERGHVGYPTLGWI